MGIGENNWQKTQSQLTISLIRGVSGTTVVWNKKESIMENQRRYLGENKFRISHQKKTS